MHRINKKLHLAVCAALAASTAYPFVSVQAATTPEAGQILQQIERDLEVKPLPVQPVIEQSAPEPEDQGPKVVVKKFKFEGNKSLNAAELEGALETLTGREISISQLKGAVDLIAAFYREKGFLATATLPEQDITEGVITINIVEAVFGDVKVDGEYGKDYKRIRPSVIERVVNASAPKGQSLDQSKLDRGLALLQKMVGFNISPSYQAGNVAGTTDLLVKVQDKPLFSGSFSADNSGGRSTGRDKQTASIALASPFGFGDALNLTALHSNGTDYTSVAYSIPVGSRGLELGVNSSYLEYTVIANEFSANKPKGRAVVYGVEANYPLLTGRRGSLNLEANFDNKSYVNRARDGADSNYVDTSDYKVNVFSLVLSGSYTDNLLAGGVNNGSLNFANGHVDMDGSYDYLRDESRKAEDKKAENTQGYYNRVKWGLSRNQFITNTLVLTLEGSGQIANQNLDSSEKFYLGGMNGVRAYPTSEGAGSEGYLFKAELRKYLPNNFNVSLFMDDGKVKQFRHSIRNDGTESLLDTAIDQPNEYHLRGYGATLGWNGPYNSSFKAIYSHRMGSNPNPKIDTNTGAVLDQDGSLRRHVLWLTGSIAF